MDFHYYPIIVFSYPFSLPLSQMTISKLLISTQISSPILPCSWWPCSLFFWGNGNYQKSSSPKLPAPSTTSAPSCLPSCSFGWSICAPSEARSLYLYKCFLSHIQEIHFRNSPLFPVTRQSPVSMWSFSRAYKHALISPIVKALPWADFTIPANVQLFSASNVLVPVLSQNVSNQASAPILPPKLLWLGPSMTTMLLSPMINYSSSTYQQHLKLLTTPSWTPSSCCFCDTFSWIFSSQSDRLFSASFAGSTQSFNTGMPQSSRFSLFSVLLTFVLLEISRTLFPSPYTLRVPNLPCLTIALNTILVDPFSSSTWASPIKRIQNLLPVILNTPIYSQYILKPAPTTVILKAPHGNSILPVAQARHWSCPWLLLLLPTYQKIQMVLPSKYVKLWHSSVENFPKASYCTLSWSQGVCNVSEALQAMIPCCPLDPWLCSPSCLPTPFQPHWPPYPSLNGPGTPPSQGMCVFVPVTRNILPQVDWRLTPFPFSDFTQMLSFKEASHTYPSYKSVPQHSLFPFSPICYQMYHHLAHYQFNVFILFIFFSI